MHPGPGAIYEAQGTGQDMPGARGASEHPVIYAMCRLYGRVVGMLAAGVAISIRPKRAGGGEQPGDAAPAPLHGYYREEVI